MSQRFMRVDELVTLAKVLHIDDQCVTATWLRLLIQVETTYSHTKSSLSDIALICRELEYENDHPGDVYYISDTLLLTALSINWRWR